MLLTRPRTRPAHLAEGPPPGPSGFREAPRAARASASSSASGSDSDSESKPEARNSSTVSSARRLRAPTPESRAPASPAPAPLPGHGGTQRGPCGLQRRGEAHRSQTLNSPLAAPHRRHALRWQRELRFRTQNAARQPDFRRRPRPLPRPARWLCGSPAAVPAVGGREGVCTSSVPRAPSSRDARRRRLRLRPVWSRLPRASARALGGTRRSRFSSVRGSDNTTDLASGGLGPTGAPAHRVTASPGSVITCL